MRAFILGAGLGTRLRPLTNRLPKPLVPLFHRPLAEWAMLACERAGIAQFAVNTHHLPQAWAAFGQPAATECPEWFGENGEPVQWRCWNQRKLALFHEPTLLETGGGLKNISRWVGDSPLLVHNGDIFSTLPLDRLIAAHRASGLPATLALRSHQGLRNVEINLAGDRVTDLRGARGIGPGTHAFSGIYCVQPEFLHLLSAGTITSVIPAFLELAALGKLGAIVLDDGVWLDLGDRTAYLQAHRELSLAPPLHASARISSTATIERSVVGPGAEIGHNAVLRDSVVWPGACILPGTLVDQCIVYSETPIHGVKRNEDC